MKFKKIGEIQKEHDQTKRMRPIAKEIFFDHPFRNYRSFKKGSQNIK